MLMTIGPRCSEQSREDGAGRGHGCIARDEEQLVACVPCRIRISAPCYECPLDLYSSIETSAHVLGDLQR